MKTRLIKTLIVFIIAFLATSVQAQSQVEDEIRETVLNGYVNGAFNALNPEAMGETFHEEFAIFSTDGENLNRYPIANWIQNTAAQKNHPNFDPADNVWDHSFSSVDVTGNSAMVKLELFHEGNHVFTDYLSLLKFNEGWKIVAKVFTQHEPG